MASLSRSLRISVAPLPWGVVLLAWALALALRATGQDALLSHDAILEQHRLPLALALPLFVLAWPVMTAAMMLPTSLPMVRAFVRLSRGQAAPRAARALFVGAYFAVWTGFALAALTVDAGLHRLVDRWPWLAAHLWLIAGSVLLLAGLLQFGPLRARCLDTCRSPAAFLWRFYRRGKRAAWELGVRHALFCLGCCWALMLVMFAVGVGSLVWMAALTGVMLVEKTAPWGHRLVPPVGGALVVWGSLVLLHVAWLPAALSARP